MTVWVGFFCVLERVLDWLEVVGVLAWSKVVVVVVRIVESGVTVFGAGSACSAQ